MIHFYKTRKNEVILELNEHRIILSNPSIQPFNTFKYEDKSDIFHFYYNVKIQFNKNYFEFLRMTREERKENDLEEGKKTKKEWVTIAESYVCEFGAIEALEEYIDLIIASNPDEIGTKEYLYYRDRDGKKKSETDYESSFEVSCTGMLEEDSYIIKKVHRHFDESYDDEIDDYVPLDYYWYDVYIGIGSESKSNTVGIRSSHLKEEELMVIKKWAKAFMELAKTKTKENIDKMLNDESDEYDCDPAWFKNHIKNKYPEDFDKWKEIWIKLYNEDFIRNEYWRYVKGEEIKEPIFSKWNSEKAVNAQELIKNGMKDWLAYLLAYEFYALSHTKKIDWEERKNLLIGTENEKDIAIKILKESINK